jgi:hypothetical protein
MRSVNRTVELVERAGGALVEGIVCSREGGGAVLVRFEGDGGAPVQARVLDAAAAGLAAGVALPAPALLLVPGAGAASPVVIGLIRERLDAGTDRTRGAAPPDAAPSAVADRELVINGRRLVLDARDEIVLRCGRSTIELRVDGKIIIRGTHLLSRSSGINRIKGGAVSIN